ncbi:MAG: DUF4331 domain-containing protein [Caldilinea sp. CFX5]|nr:DUF4331 domain-containing protein [Caldilinea sp. CFX5]
MSDHFSGPRAIADPAADIADLYAFPSPERPGWLVLVLNVFPLAAPGALFSDALIYRFRLRPVTVSTDGARSMFQVDQREYAFTCTFTAPDRQADRDTWVQTGVCTTPTGESVAFQVNDEQGSEAKGLHLFAGLRLDPFFIDLPGVQATNKLRRLAFQPKATNLLAGQNVLTILVEAEIGRHIGERVPSGRGPLFAVAGEIVTAGKHPVRLERIGRPEIKNVVLSAKEFDTVNRDLEIRDLYNQEDPFHLSKEYAGVYRARFNANLAFFDSLDGKTDWPLDDQGNHPLTELLLADFLVIDLAKPYSETSYGAIERALLRGRTPETCGGRSLNDDIVATLYNLLVNADNGPYIQHGVQATQPATDHFPYLVRPNAAPPDLKANAARQAPPKEAM